jgi:uncharacterized protein
MKIKNFIIGGAIFIVALIIGFSANTAFTRNLSVNTEQSYYSTNQENNTGVLGGETIQNANLALVDFSYKLTPNKILKGVPVKITVDANTLSGCMKTVVIKDFGITKYITSNDNIIEFTPNKTGTFWITCSMGMGPGSFEVVNVDGTAAATNAVQNTQALFTTSGSTCNANGASCGCSGR